jgi:adenine-specific DNA-methyltransferase
MQTCGVKYIGSKLSLLETILTSIESHLENVDALQVIDVCAGTTRVGQAFRSKGWSVQSSDLSWASEAYANAFLLRTAESGARIGGLLEELSNITPVVGWITTNYCDVSGSTGGLVRMWRPENGRKADGIREKIAEWEQAGHINHHEAMILVACLIFALDKVDNSVGVQQAYLKTWATRTSDPLTLRDLPFHDGPVGKHTIGDCLEIAYEEADLAYIDPPYSAHSYSTYYHIWDSITRWDKPAVSLTTNRRVDRVAGASEFDEGMVSLWNSKKTALQSFMTICESLPARNILISYNNESILPAKTLVDTLRDKFGLDAVSVEEIQYKRNIMSQIGNATLYKDEFKTENVEYLIWVKRY